MRKARKTYRKKIIVGYRARKNSERMKARWADPEYRAQRAAQIEANKGKPQVTRRGVPDGMTKAQANVLWDQARAQARKFIGIMEDANQVERTPVPGTEAEMAKKTLEEAFVMAVGPLTDAKTRSQYMRIVLDFTKAKPESKSKLTLDKSEEWLEALAKDMKNNDGSNGGSE